MQKIPNFAISLKDIKSHKEILDVEIIHEILAETQMHKFYQVSKVNAAHNQFTILDEISVHLDIADIETKFSTSGQASQLVDTAAQILSAHRNCWQPRALFGWFILKKITDNHVTLAHSENSELFELNTGYSGSFLKQAEMVMAGLYTCGNELESAAKKAAREKQYLDGYILEQIGLIVLEKTGAFLNSIIEKEASKRKWGVGPLLSPGSVHGWDLIDQTNLCSHLPLREISVHCSGNGVLTPFNSLSFIIGIGREYNRTLVGSPCEVCSNREKCSLRKEKNVS